MDKLINATIIAYVAVAAVCAGIYIEHDLAQKRAATVVEGVREKLQANNERLAAKYPKCGTAEAQGKLCWKPN